MTASPRHRISRILLVEDVDAMRMFLKLSLDREGVVLEEAATLRQARQALRGGFVPDLVILDLELGDGCGLDLIRELPVTASVHVLTGDTSAEMRLRCEEAGCGSVIDKQRNVGVVVASLLDAQPRPLSEGKQRMEEDADRRYAEFLAECRVKLKAYEADGISETLRTVAHRLRGTAVHFGYSGLSDSARSLSAALELSDPAATAQAAASLSAGIGEALESFRLNNHASNQEELHK